MDIDQTSSNDNNKGKAPETTFTPEIKSYDND